MKIQLTKSFKITFVLTCVTLRDLKSLLTRMQFTLTSYLYKFNLAKEEN